MEVRDRERESVCGGGEEQPAGGALGDQSGNNQNNNRDSAALQSQHKTRDVPSYETGELWCCGVEVLRCRGGGVRGWDGWLVG